MVLGVLKARGASTWCATQWWSRDQMSDVTAWCRFVKRDLHIETAPLMLRVVKPQWMVSFRKVGFGHSQWHTTFHRIEVQIVAMASKADWNIIADCAFRNTCDPFHSCTQMSRALNAQFAKIKRLWHQINPYKSIMVLSNRKTYAIIQSIP